MRVFGMITTQASAAYTAYALKSFFAYTPLRPFDEFVLIDNDRSFELPQDIHPQLIRIQNDSPKSFAANVNEVMARAFPKRADLIFLNNDLIFTEGWLEPMLVPEHAILSPLSNREIQHTVNGFTWSNALSLEEYTERVDDFRLVAESHWKNLRGQEQVLALPFFCVKIPFTVYSEIGPLDERFGKGGAEDYDYCLRASIAGIPVKYTAQSYVLHFSGKSTWSGAEDEAATKNRRALYTRKFVQKWGQALCDLLIEEKHSIIDENPELQRLFSLGKISDAVKLLQSEQDPG